MDIVGIDIDVVKEVVPHEAVIGLLMFLWQSDILIEIKSGHRTKVQSFLVVHADEFLVELQWCAAGRHTYHGVWLFAHQSCDDSCCGCAASFSIVIYNNFH